MFAEVITGIALVNKSVDFIKNNISTARDIGQIAKQIDDLFEGKAEKMQELTTIITVVACMGGAAILLIGVVYILTR